MKEIRPRLSGRRLTNHRHFNQDEWRVGIIGDTHEPFTLPGYLEFCKETFEKYNVNRIIHIGDVADHHYSSYHETDADGLGGADELELTIDKLKAWSKIFPEVECILGNHDLIISRKAQTSNLPSRWLKEYGEVLELPSGWTFHHELIIDNVKYIHGIGSKSHIRCRKDMQSVVQGHHHTDCYTQWFVGSTAKIFGMQVGCGIDKDAYAMAYGKWHPKPAIGCGIVIGGHTAINVLMDL